MKTISDFLRRDKWMNYAKGHVVLLHWIKTKLSWKPEFFFNYSERSIWAYRFVKKRRRVFALFESNFLRNQSLGNASWFCSKKPKIWKGILYLFLLCFFVRRLFTIIWVTCVKKNFEIRTLTLVLPMYFLLHILPRGVTMTPTGNLNLNYLGFFPKCQNIR